MLIKWFFFYFFLYVIHLFAKITEKNHHISLENKLADMQIIVSARTADADKVKKQFSEDAKEELVALRSNLGNYRYSPLLTFFVVVYGLVSNIVIFCLNHQINSFVQIFNKNTKIYHIHSNLSKITKILHISEIILL